MAPADAEVDVLLYGATGFTGRLTAQALEREGVSYAIAGRDAKKLERLSGSLPSRPRRHAVGIDDAPGLERLARGARVVVSAAGPYIRLGPPVFEAAIAAGSHFIDVSGEQVYLRWAHAQDARVRDARITAVNAMGLDTIPGDVAALIATSAMQAPTVEIAYWSPARISRGTLASMAAHSGKGGWYEDGEFVAAPPGRFRHRFRFPAPYGEREGIFIPWGDVVTAPRSTKARRVRTYFIGKRSRMRLMHAAWPAIALGWRTGITRRILERRLKTHEDPTPEERAATPWRVLAEATDMDGTVQRGYVAGTDPYGFTGAAAAQGARILAREDAPRGVHTFSQAFAYGPFFAALAGFPVEVRGRSLKQASA